jgi:hypothetical protein
MHPLIEKKKKKKKAKEKGYKVLSIHSSPTRHINLMELVCCPPVSEPTLPDELLRVSTLSC